MTHEYFTLTLEKMENTIDKTVYQTVLCIQDSQLYVYNIAENPCFLDDDFSLIKCFLVRNHVEPDFSKEIEIYGKYLISNE